MQVGQADGCFGVKLLRFVRNTVHVVWARFAATPILRRRHGLSDSLQAKIF